MKAIRSMRLAVGVTLLALAAFPAVCVADVIAAWDFQTGVGIQPAPNTSTTYAANLGSGTLFANGTNGSSAWVTAAADNELTALNGDSIVAYTGLSPSPSAPGCLAVLAGRATVANGKSISFRISMSGRSGLLVSYGTASSSSSTFDTQTWSCSRDGSTWTTFATVTGPARPFGQQVLPVTYAVDGAATAYVRVTFTGASSGSGNNRLDNIVIAAAATPGTVSASGGSTPGADGWIGEIVGAASGWFQGNSANNGGGSLAGAGTVAWGFFSSGSSQSSGARRDFAGGALAIGQSASVRFDNGFVSAGSVVGVEFLYGTTVGLRVALTGGDSFYKVTDALGTATTTQGVTSDGIAIGVRRTGNGSCSVVVGGYAGSVTLSNGAPTVDGIRVFNVRAGVGPGFDVFANDLVISGIDADGDGVVVPLDCDDRNASIGAGTVWYRDADGDGYGDALVRTVSCVPSTPAGYVADGSDCNDGDAAINPTTRWYPDADGDGVGVQSGSVVQCTAPAGFVRTTGDECPNDANKLSPGGCGCGTPDRDLNADGIADCLQAQPLVSTSIVGGGSAFKAGDLFTVRIGHSAPAIAIVQANLSLAFSTAALELVSATTVAGSPFQSVISQSLDASAGTLRFVVASASGTSAAASTADATFRVRAGAGACDAAGLVAFASIPGQQTSLVASTGATIAVQTSPLGVIRADGSAPDLAGVPAARVVATDAGATIGAAIAAPTVTANDGCDGGRAVELAVAYPDGTTGSTWPAGGLFPIGITTLAWTSVDAVGNQVQEVRTVEVKDWQLLDASMTLDGAIRGNSTRTFRVEAGGTARTVQVAMAGANGASTGIQVPVAAGYPCIRVKDTMHSLSRVAAPVVIGGSYVLAVTLPQGDTNDDDKVDILDFSAFVVSRGGATAPEHPANFNSDTVVDNADLTFLSGNFFKVGEGCAGMTGIAPPLARVSVRDLRRMGLGYLAAADLNRDGWVDQADVVQFMQVGAPLPAQPWDPPVAED